MKELINKERLQVEDQIIEWRRHLHQNPELSFEEIHTSDFIYQTLLSFGNLELSRPTKTSVVARLIGDQPGKKVAIRADIDALPIVEESNLPYASKKHGVMHACGHDAHTAMLLGTAKVMANLKKHIKGEVRFIFQHAEELFPGGARELVEAGVMEGVDQIICAHVRSHLEVGKIGVLSGPVLAANDSFKIKIIGSGGHAAKPHQNIDSVVISAQVITNLQQIVSRQIDPIEDAVLSITQIHGGKANNVIPQYVELEGTVRSFNTELQADIPELMERIIKGVTEAHGATYEFEYTNGYLPVINDSDVSETVRKTVVELYGEDALEKIEPGMGSEDFSAYLQKVPGCFFYLGAGAKGAETYYPHHHPKFEIDEKALPIGLNIYLNFLKKLVM